MVRISGFIQSNSLIICGNSNVMIDCLRAQSPVVYFWSGASDLFDVLGCQLFNILSSICSKSSQIIGLLIMLDSYAFGSSPSLSSQVCWSKYFHLGSLTWRVNSAFAKNSHLSKVSTE